MTPPLPGMGGRCGRAGAGGEVRDEDGGDLSADGSRECGGKRDEIDVGVGVVVGMDAEAEVEAKAA